ncbi:MAG TPA: barstar family protein [Burkholderiales bacterium]|nr:barstar family protein [Burkholderiales bacterium]
MAKLLQRLSDAAKSGVYRASRLDAIEDALRGSRLSLARVGLQDVTGKSALLRRIAVTLGFPAWFGENWDALEDCLTDLSWREGDGHVLVFEGFQFLPTSELGELIDVMSSAAKFWAGRAKPFFAVFIDPDRALALASLYQEA